jgi:hypothetical protein
MKLQESIDGYKQVLRKNPADEDARFRMPWNHCSIRWYLKGLRA